MKLTFLNAAVALTKSYTKHTDGTIEKSSYPNVWEVSSIIEDCPDLKTMEALINKHGSIGNCLLKGMVTRNLVCESRKDSTDRNATTEFLCLDLDGIEPTFTAPVTQYDPTTGQPIEVYQTLPVTVDTILDAMGMSDVSYVLQWSGSMNISSPALRCHVFIMLSKPVSAPLIKQWLIQKNHEVAVLRNAQTLTKTGNALSWGLDITACQSDKLIYITPPVLKGIKNPLGRTPRISYVKKANATFELTGKINSTDQNRALTDARILELRDLQGLPKRKLTYKHVGAHEVLVKPGECIVTDMKTDRGFVYFNLNGGDSWAYFHPENNPDYIFNFKGEPVYLTKELIPSYWEQLNSQAYRQASNGLTYLAFLDRATSTYYRGTYDSAADDLQIFSARTESMVRQFADANGMRLGANIPEWSMEFNPQDNVRVDFANQTVNTFQLTSYMRKPLTKKVAKCPPTVFKIIGNVLGNDLDAVEHFMNWLAFIAQFRDRTTTAWIFQGTFGTGKGVLMNQVLKPIFGETQTVIKRAGELSEKWTDFVVGKFIIFIDEVQTSAFSDEAGVIANLKNFITEPTVTVRMMNKNAYAMENYGNWLFASNKPDPVKVDKGDRRFNVGPYQPNKLILTQAEFDAIPGELQEFYHYLMSYAVDKDQARSVLENESRSTLIQLSQTTSESTATALTEGDMDYFIDQLPTDDSYKLDSKRLISVEEYRRTLCNLLGRTKPNGLCNVHRDELFILFNYMVGDMSPSPAKFTKFLGHRQLEVKPLLIPGHTKTGRGITVTWKTPSTFPAMLKTYFSDMSKSKTP